MPIALDEELRNLRNQIASVQARKARAEVVKENAQEALKKSRTILADEFGVRTPDEARSALADLTNALEAAVASVRQELEAAGA